MGSRAGFQCADERSRVTEEVAGVWMTVNSFRNIRKEGKSGRQEGGMVTRRFGVFNFFRTGIIKHFCRLNRRSHWRNF